MTNGAVVKLTSLGSAALTNEEPAHAQFEPLGKRGLELFELLSRQNGFYAFESALHVFGSVGGDEVGLFDWNDDSLWRHEYGSLAEGCFFFAEDVFGGQFGIQRDQIIAFDPETGEVSAIAGTVEAWAQAILDDYDVLTGYPLARQWQVERGPIPPPSRLVPKVPFVCGGEFEIENLVLLDAGEAMRARGQLATQLHELPDGARVTFRISD